jgi:hypothetical protein
MVVGVGVATLVVIAVFDGDFAPWRSLIGGLVFGTAAWAAREMHERRDKRRAT